MLYISRLTALWGWLPAFRAVAETENVHEAARHLHVTPSALSRSVKLLECEVGVALFDRTRGKMRLTREGQALLDSVRGAMRAVDDGLALARDEGLQGVAGVLCEGEHAASCLSRVLAALHREHGFVGHVDTHWCADVPAMLVRGELDVAFVTEPPREGHLAITVAGTLHHDVYCGPSHPLAARSDVSVSDVLAHSFVALTSDVSHAKNAGCSPWPRELTRKVALYAPSVRDASELCARGELLAVLPRAVGPHSELQALVRLPHPELPAQDLFAVTRRPISGRRTRADIIVDAMRHELAAQGNAPSSCELAAPPSYPMPTRSSR